MSSAIGKQLLWPLQFRQDRAHCFVQAGEIASYHVPNGLKVHIEIVMRKDVSHSSNGSPVNLGMLVLVPRIDPLRRLT